MSNPDVITRRCYACKLIKPIDEFAPCKEKLYGKSYRCKACALIYTRAWAKRNKEKMRGYFRTYEEKNRAERRYKHRKNLPAHNTRSKRYRLKHPIKTRVRYAVAAAVRYGRMIKPETCQRCGAKDKIQAHHHRGYAWKHRLDVQWLCTQCHGLAHRLDKGRDGLASSSHIA